MLVQSSLLHHYLYSCNPLRVSVKSLGCLLGLLSLGALNSSFSLPSPTELPEMLLSLLPTTFYLHLSVSILHGIGQMPQERKWYQNSELHLPSLWNRSHSSVLVAL